MKYDPEFYAAGTALIGAIATLWRIVIKRANDCEQKHEKTTGELMNMKEEVGELKGRVQIAEQIVPKLNAIHLAVSHREPREEEPQDFL